MRERVYLGAIYLVTAPVWVPATIGLYVADALYGETYEECLASAETMMAKIAERRRPDLRSGPHAVAA